VPDLNHLPAVVQALPGPDATVYVYFADGRITQYDAKPLIHPGSVFEPLADPRVFEGALTVLDGTVAWALDGTRDPATALDIAPEAVYSSPRVSDPLAVRGA
jgi:hypothetical protein